MPSRWPFWIRRTVVSATAQTAHDLKLSQDQPTNRSANDPPCAREHFLPGQLLGDSRFPLLEVGRCLGQAASTLSSWLPATSGSGDRFASEGRSGDATWSSTSRAFRNTWSVAGLPPEPRLWPSLGSLPPGLNPLIPTGSPLSWNSGESSSSSLRIAVADSTVVALDSRNSRGTSTHRRSCASAPHSITAPATYLPESTERPGMGP